MDDAQALLEQPTRLRVMGLLYRHRDLAARDIREHLGLTDGNLASHAARLGEAGLLEARNALSPRGFEVRYRITAQGSAAMRATLDRLRSLIAEWDGT